MQKSTCVIKVGSHKIKMSRGPELSAPAFESHLEQVRRRYGHQVLVNLLGSSLVGSKEGEATLSTAFQTHHKGDPDPVCKRQIIVELNLKSGIGSLFYISKSVFFILPTPYLFFSSPEMSCYMPN